MADDARGQGSKSAGTDNQNQDETSEVDGALKASLPTFAPKTGLEDDALEASAAALTTNLADTTLLFQKTLAVHWSVAGSAFSALHELTEQQYKALFAAVDEIAERIRALGRAPPPTVAAMMGSSTLEDAPLPETAEGMIEALADDHEAICRFVRDQVETCEDNEDYVTSDLFVERLTYHEKASWMLRATLAR